VRVRAPIVFLAAAVCTVGALGACARHDHPQNVLLVSIDSLRADRLGCYGNARPTSPVIDRLAAEGVVFEDAISPTSWTLPSQVTLLTGRLPHHHGTVAWRDRIASGEHLLAEVFATRGYETVGFYSGPFLAPYYGFQRGFARYISCEPEADDPTDPIATMVRSHDYRTNPLIEERFASWVASRSTRPFFAFVHMWDVHFDYVPPPPYDRLFDPDYTGPLDGRHIIDDGFPPNSPPRDVVHLLALYDGEIRATDETLGHLLDALARAGALDNTLVVVTSDHGEEFQEHRGKTHHRTVYTESVHVPLVFWARAGLPRGRRIAGFVSLADVAPTILELVRLPALERQDGTSLVPAIAGRPLDPRPVLSGMYLPGGEWRRMLAIRAGSESDVFWAKNGTWVRYDVAGDPHERLPRMLPDGPVRARLAEYDREVMALLGSRTKDAQPATAAPPPDIVEHLKELGYVH
jgi:arylsulfatase A-like enzyme